MEAPRIAKRDENKMTEQSDCPIGSRARTAMFRKRQRSSCSASISSPYQRFPILLSLLILFLRDNISVGKSKPVLTYSAVAFQDIGLVHKCRSLHQRVSNADISIPLLATLDEAGENQNSKIRLNKVFKKTHSRREADRLIEEGRVSVNGERVSTKGGFFVVPYVDEISLDGKVIEGWEEMNFVANSSDNNSVKAKSKRNQTSKHKSTNEKGENRAAISGKKGQQRTFEYIKYWKPRGVICTTDPNIRGNIIDEIREHDGYDPPHRVYPVGRLDKDTTGIILLTSDGRLPNAALRKEHKRPKVYEVMVDPPIGPPGSRKARGVLDRLQNGVVISTETVRNGVRKTLTAPTEPCKVAQINDRWIRITLREGRNRQVRKMTQAVGHRTVELERVSFAGIPLEPGLRGPGDWDYLKGEELEIVQDMIRIATEAQEAEGAYWEDNE